MSKPRKAYDPKKHHLPTETHRMDNHTLLTLVQLRTAMINMQSLESNILARVAQDRWNYKPGLVLEFLPDLEKATCQVTILKEEGANQS